VNQLDGAGGGEDAPRAHAGDPGRGDHEDRTEPLASGEDAVPHRPVDELRRGVGGREKTVQGILDEPAVLGEEHLDCGRALT
jgi:hypothetical protein